MKVNKIISLFVAVAITIVLCGCGNCHNDVVDNKNTVTNKEDSVNQELMELNNEHENDKEHEEKDNDISRVDDENDLIINSTTDGNSDITSSNNEVEETEKNAVVNNGEEPEVLKEDIKEEPVAQIIEGTAEEKEMFNLVNNERVKAGLNKLEWSNELYEVSKIRAKEASVCWSHTRPNGLNYSSLFYELAITNCTVSGENLASNFLTVSDAMVGLMNSDGHKANILKSKYKKIAISIYTDSNNNVFIAQIFSD